MGAISFSLDVALAHLMQRELRCDTFFESGGFEGDTLALVEGLFKRVISVELAPTYAQNLRTRFRNSKNVEIIEGDSAVTLERLKPKLAAARALYWLDAHWCDANSVDAAIHQCPLLRELRALGSLNEHSAVIIDDARLFLAPPLAPHEVSDWPTWSQISRTIEVSSGSTHDVMVVNDCIVVFPRSMQRSMADYAQASGADWLKITDLSREHAAMASTAEERLQLINELHAAAAQANNAVSAAHERLGVAQSELNEKQAALTELHEGASKSHEENRSLTASLSVLRSDLDTREVALTLLRQSESKLQVANRSLTESLKVLRGELDAKELALTALRQNESKLQAENRSLTESLNVLRGDFDAKEIALTALRQNESKLTVENRSLTESLNLLRGDLDAKEIALTALRQHASKSRSENLSLTQRLYLMQSELEAKEGVIQAMAETARHVDERMRALSTQHELASAGLRAKEEVIFAIKQRRIELERQLATASEKTLTLEQIVTELRTAELQRQDAFAALTTSLTERDHENRLIREQSTQLREEDLSRRLATAEQVASFEQTVHELRAGFARLQGEALARTSVMAVAADALAKEEPVDTATLEPAARALLSASAKHWQQQAVEKEAVIQELATAIAAHRAALARQALPVRMWQQSKARIQSAIRPKLGVLNQHPPIPLGDRNITSRRLLRADQFLSISIVTPSFRQAHLIERTIASVVNQQYPKLEYFIQDGGSDDGTTDVLERWKDRVSGWESKPDGGQSAAINLGFAKTTGDIMAWLNSDDLLMPGSLNYVAAYFQRHPDVDVIYGDRLLIDEDDALIGRWVLPGHSAAVLPWADFVPQETLFWRRSIWDRAGGKIDESFKFAMDWDLLLRFRSAGARFAHLPKFLGAFRIHASQKTSAAISDVGFKEMDRLRLREMGREVSHVEIRKAITPFMVRHVLADKLAAFR